MKKMKKKSEFKYIRAVVDGGDVSFEWQLAKAGAPPGGVAHDEDVSEWSDGDIQNLGRQMAGADDDDPVVVEVHHR